MSLKHRIGCYIFSSDETYGVVTLPHPLAQNVTLLPVAIGLNRPRAIQAAASVENGIGIRVPQVVLMVIACNVCATVFREYEGMFIS